MKNLLISALLLIFVSAVQSQNVYDEAIKFSYEQPSMFFLNSERTYQCELVLAYENDVKTKTEEINNENERRIAEAKQELDDYNAKSTGSKIAENLLLNEKKPTGEAVLLTMPYLQNLWDKDNFLNSYLTITGLEKNTNSKSKIVLTINPVTEFFATKEVPDKGFKHIVNAEVSINIKAYNDEGVQVLDNTQRAPSTVYTSSYTKSAAENDKAWEASKKSKSTELEIDATKKAMKNVCQYLTETLGYPIIDRKSNVFMVKEKKFSYADINSAFPIIAEAYGVTIDKDQLEYRTSKINEAIAIWESALKEQDLSDKKARINKDIVAALYLNIGEGYFWLNDFTKARQYLAKHKALDVNGYRRDYNKIDETIIDYKKRFEANTINN